MAKKVRSASSRNFAKEMVGNRFGRLVVLRREGIGRDGRTAWRCKCDCGEEHVTSGKSLRTNHTRSCGCARREKSSEFMRRLHTTHGGTYSHEFRVWTGIKTRCLNRNDRGFKSYGGRGIEVCERWQTSFEAFLADVGRRPTPEHFIERKDNEGHYEPGNVTWATRSEQANNRRSSRWLEFQGRRQTVMQWAREIGLKHSTLTMRFERGWSVVRALSTPVARRRRRRNNVAVKLGP